MKFILSLSLISFFTLSALSQSNQHLENSTWVNAYYTYQVQNGWAFKQLSSTTKYCTTTQDTAINSKSYKVLYDCTDSTLVYRGALRADSIRWYFVAKDSATEMLLYDFSLMPGDTVKEPVFTEFFFSPQSHPYVCGQVDTIQVNGQNRRRVNLDGYGFWIEGVGCSQGLLWDPEPNISSFLITLECYDKADDVHYTATSYDQSLSAGRVGCDLSFALSENVLADNFSVYPNPSAGTFTAKAKTFHEELEIAVFNLKGKKVYSQVMARPEIQLKLNLPEGIYLLKYEGKNGAGSELIEIRK